MENATKALLIAGSVLIAILLIAMGLRIFNSTSETTEQSQKVMDTTAAATFNSQFTGYFGDISAAKGNDLIQKIKASNAVNKSYPVEIIVNGSNVTDSNTYFASSVKIKNVKATAWYEQGYIKQITMTAGN